MKENLTYSYLFYVNDDQLYAAINVESFEEAWQRALDYFNYQDISDATVYELGYKHKILITKPKLVREL